MPLTNIRSWFLSLSTVGGLLKYVLLWNHSTCSVIYSLTAPYHTSWLMIGVSYLAFCELCNLKFLPVLSPRLSKLQSYPYADHGLKAQGMEGELRGIYRSRFQPYAAIWTITW